VRPGPRRNVDLADDRRAQHGARRAAPPAGGFGADRGGARGAAGGRPGRAGPQAQIARGAVVAAPARQHGDALRPGSEGARDQAVGLPDAALLRRSRMVEMTPDEAERYLDLAGFADGRLDPDDCERVAEWLAGDPAAAGDIAAARALATRADAAEAMSEPAI